MMMTQSTLMMYIFLMWSQILLKEIMQMIMKIRGIGFKSEVCVMKKYTVFWPVLVGSC